MGHIYRADKGLVKKKIQHLVDKALREFNQEFILFFFLSCFSFTFWDLKSAIQFDPLNFSHSINF